MRTGPALISGAAAAPLPELSNAAAGRSAWHSPVPYLFGGLAAMLGLIAFALLLLACSYLKLSRHVEGGEAADEAANEAGSAVEKERAVSQFAEGIVVIMAGDEKPTFLATPISSKAAYLGGNVSRNDGEEKDGKDGKAVEDAVSTPSGQQSVNQSSCIDHQSEQQ